jgi:hypothetical protein
MDKSTSLEILRSAVQIEQQEALDRTRRYAAFMKQMEAFQKGEGPAPSTEAFEQWCEDVQRRQALFRLISGAHDPPWDAPEPCAVASSQSSLSYPAGNGALGRQ